ncbi:MAG: DNA sulfur modification protein DndD [Planctomycetia bacterium]|nr:DNA sulfur modification protein DndD [Planctomycetia bacterium]
MFLRSIRLRDWKAYAQAEFEFPYPTRNKNVVLIGAKNGYGKTSVLEALILGLYGKDGMNALARAVASASDSERSYDRFLERALHQQAIDQGRQSMCVEIVLEDQDNRLKIVRKWHFNGTGKHRRDQEDLQLFWGEDEEPVQIRGPKATRDDRDDFLRSQIARHFIPFHLTEFFLFDGERVQQLAKQEKADTVRLGIEGVLGVQLLRELQGHLRDYANSRRSSGEHIEDEAIQRADKEAEACESQLVPIAEQLAAIEAELAPVQTRSDELTRTLRTMTGGSAQNVRELAEEKFRWQRQKDRIGESLNGVIRADLCLALVGSDMRAAVSRQLSAEIKRSEWLTSKNHTREKLSVLIAAIAEKRQGLPDIYPDLTEAQHSAIADRLGIAWESLWHPLPAECATSELHGFLTDLERHKVIERLAGVETHGVAELASLIQQHDEATQQIDRCIRESAQISGIEERIKTVTDELEATQKRTSELREKSGNLRREKEAMESRLASARAEHGRLASRHKSAQPQIARARKALQVAELIGDAISDLYPSYVDRLATEMGSIYRSLAHKTLVRKIEIDAACNVRLLGDRNRDIREMDSSAGEEQIFALALIGAIAQVSGISVPIVMDTPLARLDTDHRTNVLRYFAAQSSEQVIFLSQPDEINGDYLAAIQGRVAKSYHVDFEELGNGVGVAKVREGYFK